MKRLVTLFLLMITVAVAQAHQDVIFVLKKDGSITGLPPEYQPATLQVQFEKLAAGNKLTSIALAIDENRVVIPACLTHLVRSESADGIDLHGSWYHDTEYLPEYMSVMFPDPGFGRETWMKSGYSFLFNLNTAKLIRVERHDVVIEGREVQMRRLSMEDVCADFDLNQFVDERYETPQREAS